MVKVEAKTLNSGDYLKVTGSDNVYQVWDWFDDYRKARLVCRHTVDAGVNIQVPNDSEVTLLSEEEYLNHSGHLHWTDPVQERKNEQLIRNLVIAFGIPTLGIFFLFLMVEIIRLIPLHELLFISIVMVPLFIGLVVLMVGLLTAKTSKRQFASMFVGLAIMIIGYWLFIGPFELLRYLTILRG